MSHKPHTLNKQAYYLSTHDLLLYSFPARYTHYFFNKYISVVLKITNLLI